MEQRASRKMWSISSSAEKRLAMIFHWCLIVTMALSVPYSITLARRLGWKWFAFHLDGGNFCHQIPMMATKMWWRQLVIWESCSPTGEHEYTRWGFKQLLDKKAAHILQPDITWLGGITEARRVMVIGLSQWRAGSATWILHLFLPPSICLYKCTLGRIHQPVTRCHVYPTIFWWPFSWWTFAQKR